MDNRDDADFRWIRHCEAASLELRQGRIAAAEDQWRKAFVVVQRFDDADPRVGASLNNMGVAERLRGHRDKAESLYRAALENWNRAEDWVRDMRLQPRARSSLFHMRLEKKHREAYDRIAVKPYFGALLSGTAATRNNLAELLYIENRLDQSRKLLAQALEERSTFLVQADPGLCVIRENLACLKSLDDPSTQAPREYDSDNGEPFLEQARRRAWIVDNPPFLTDEGRLMAAILLAHVLPFTKA